MKPFYTWSKAPMMKHPLGPILQPQTCYHAISETSVLKGHFCDIRNFFLSRWWFCSNIPGLVVIYGTWRMSAWNLNVKSSTYYIIWNKLHVTNNNFVEMLLVWILQKVRSLDKKKEAAMIYLIYSRTVRQHLAIHC